jgi:hypothetical protein
VSAAFSGDGVPPGIPADYFYAKGSNLNAHEDGEGHVQPGEGSVVFVAIRLN